MARLWGGLALSAIGDQVFLVVLGWIAAEAFGTRAGLLPALQAGVVLAAALLAGDLADRFAHRSVMIACDLARALALAGLVAAWVAAGHAPGWALVGAVLVLATGNALFRPALMAVVPQLTPTPLLPATNALIDTTERIARLLGPGLIGVLASVLPLVHFVSVDAVSFVVSAGAVAALPRGARRQEGGRPAGLLRGFRAVRAHKVLGFVLGMNGVTNGAWYIAYFIGLPLMLVDQGASGVAAFGFVISAYGVTNLLTTLIVGNRPMSRRPARMIFGGNLVLGAGIVLLGVAGMVLPPGWLMTGFISAALISAVGGPMQDITVATLRQRVLHPGDIAAGTRAFIMASQGGLLVALLASPVLFALLGVPGTVLAGGVAILGCAGMGLLRLGAAAQD